MLIALLALLGVDLVVIVALLGVVVARRRWVVRQPGAFKGAVRVTDGAVEGFPPKWTRGHGRWVHDVLVWNKPPFHFRNTFMATDRAGAVRRADAGELKRLGDRPVVLQLFADGATVEVAGDSDHRDQLLGPYGKPTHACP